MLAGCTQRSGYRSPIHCEDQQGQAPGQNRSMTLSTDRGALQFLP